MKVFLVATEESGDRLGAALMQALKAKLGPSVEFRGVGGYEMAAEGLPSLFRIDDLAIVGIAGITQALPKILSRIRQTARAALDEKPDVLVIIDVPDFTHRVARRVRKKNRNIPIVDYVSPSVWAWRPGRARAMRHYIDHVLALLPFEPEVHRKLGGPTCTYVGHPLVEQIAELRPNTEEATRREQGTPLLLVLPGSRKNEIRRLIEPFGKAVERIAKTVWPLDVVIPTTPHLQDMVLRETANWPLRPKIVVKREDRRAAFRNARAALAKSGTVTLELGLVGRADDHRLQGFRHRGGDRAPADPRAVGDPDEPRARGQCGAGIHPDRLHAGTADGGTRAVACRYSRTAGSDRGVCAARRI